MRSPIARARSGAVSSKRTYIVGTPKNSVGPVVLEPVAGLLVLEPLDEAHVTAAGQPALDAVAEAVDVEERQGGEIAVGAGDAPGGEQR